MASQPELQPSEKEQMLGEAAARIIAQGEAVAQATLKTQQEEAKLAQNRSHFQAQEQNVRRHVVAHELGAQARIFNAESNAQAQITSAQREAQSQEEQAEQSLATKRQQLEQAAMQTQLQMQAAERTLHTERVSLANEQFQSVKQAELEYRRFTSEAQQDLQENKRAMELQLQEAHAQALAKVSEVEAEAARREMELLRDRERLENQLGMESAARRREQEQRDKELAIRIAKQTHSSNEIEDTGIGAQRSPDKHSEAAILQKMMSRIDAYGTQMAQLQKQLSDMDRAPQPRVAQEYGLETSDEDDSCDEEREMDFDISPPRWRANAPRTFRSHSGCQRWQEKGTRQS